MLDHLVKAADLKGIVSDTISADEVETYKPDSEIYRPAAARTGTPIDRVLHVSGGDARRLGRETRRYAHLLALAFGEGLA